MSDFQKQARTMKKKAEEMNLKISYQQSLELIAVINGYKCWSALKATSEKKVDPKKAKKELSVYANIKTEDNEFNFDFDITSWISSATDNDIVNIINSEFELDPDCGIIDKIIVENDHIESLYDYSMINRISYKITAREDDVLDWVKENNKKLSRLKKYEITLKNSIAKEDISFCSVKNLCSEKEIFEEAVRLGLTSHTLESQTTAFYKKDLITEKVVTPDNQTFNMVEYFNYCKKNDKRCLVTESLLDSSFIEIFNINNNIIYYTRITKESNFIQCSEKSDMTAPLWSGVFIYDPSLEKDKIKIKKNALSKLSNEEKLSLGLIENTSRYEKHSIELENYSRYYLISNGFKIISPIENLKDSFYDFIAENESSIIVVICSIRNIASFDVMSLISEMGKVKGGNKKVSGLIISSSGFTESSYKLAEKNNIELFFKKPE